MLVKLSRYIYTGYFTIVEKQAAACKMGTECNDLDEEEQWFRKEGAPTHTAKVNMV